MCDKLNLDETLEKFQNGERRYDEDPYFKATINSIVSGLGVYGILDHTLKELSILRERYNERAAEWSKASHDYQIKIEILETEIESWKPWTSTDRGIKKNRKNY
jgi:hypothetical protein